ncbi:MAG: adenosylcobinamide-phosphate synthase CbiB [Proteobacteria bacterium]|nr:adenosylcobinamide-phosphate synthase CbiB [Pseudomonadota bacterium]
MTALHWACVPLLALLIDRLLGEPPAWLHPVVWMGRPLGWLTPRLARLRPALAFTAGALVWLALALAVVVAAALLQTLARTLTPWLAVLLLAVLVKPLLAWRVLRREVAAVEAALAESLTAGRMQVARLVSRDVSALSETEVREATLSTLAENLNDSVVAPLFWLAVAGLPGMALYRFANTADAMWGYRDDREWLGKWAARADDVLSWLPARLTGLMLLAAGRTRPTAGWWRDARATPSPNGGWCMGALARALGVRLTKPGVYVLNPEGRAATPADTPRALAWAGRVAWVAAVLAAAGLAWGGAR